MHKAYLLLGSNMGNREFMLDKALEELEQAGCIAALSSRKETEPWGFNKPVTWFLNQVACMETELDPEELMEQCLEIERKLGRKRESDKALSAGRGSYCSRLIDIDILLYDNLKHNTPKLILPHPRLRERPFAMELLQEILPKNLSLEDFY
ncbi:MAG: 2-amino-4-hydroxy-6-hydroxymethyldihydropteridine diphosphokinase [Bacteroidales bacterium]|jgi:2-amino-4-hydroxy-6-hydroxymethyldihydropteridine diphosphokinase|nr:2-amino-4-hydroxy-6-hydroxymethyldihydropteridine diphosphokinase [Bacteroidales bacterium]MDD2263400.1 2-amino-4-hydroxy-6-hydroxymethyldihydropteridine diphosphokinase [Bacteroidales bacterium]MDD2830810.1 2-amino-4-hydroxy-6-hydroxymethyldihydropteridine diphosphokinase [Bacteroidales bacterium]MDD3208009.1 2-amino-4-hydroxy-6-hydroxymethyldihydropteridine diphosphokinase [Bacteroidales bacterium]MDD3696484.1 2-amino-4-hydroxy-6-hydroxymethyldihydropteridine diphosphokinase [Bacteroidales